MAIHVDFRKNSATCFGEGLTMMPVKGVIRQITVFSNGMVSALDENGGQIPEIQGPLHELLEELRQARASK